jgi:cobalamin synthase
MNTIVLDYIRSGWSFFFRWPVANAQKYRALGIFLGPLLQALVYLFFSLFASALLNAKFESLAPLVGWIGLSMLTGFFHEDGLADTADSLGVSKFDSGASLERIQATFKDPRLGTFGVSALVLFWMFRYVSSVELEQQILYCALICLFSRACSLGLGLYFYPRVAQARSVRSSHVMQDVRLAAGASVLMLGVALGLGVLFFFTKLPGLSSLLTAPLAFSAVLVPFALSVVFTFLLSGALLFMLIRRTEALNGDLLGATVCISEVILTICFFMIF